jgi:hypothetical protein
VPLHDSGRGLFLCCGTAINCRGSGFAVAAHVFIALNQPMPYLLVGKSPFVNSYADWRMGRPGIS